MEAFLNSDLLLSTESAKALFFGWAEDAPIFDYHNHLSPKELWENAPFPTITDLWLGADHYKWRAMRSYGIDEKYITGDGSGEEKFLAWAETVEHLPGCPLYEWAHLELQRYFGIFEPLTGASAQRIYEKCNEMLTGADFTPRALLKRMGVAHLCTTDDPFDSLEWHEKLAGEDLGFRVTPTFRPDKLLHIDKGDAWRQAAEKLACSEGTAIDGLEGLEAALLHALDRFTALGCTVSDHGFELLRYRPGGADEAQAACRRALAGKALSEAETAAFQSELLRRLGRAYTVRGLSMQLHLGALRNQNPAGFRALGPDAGYDSVGALTSPQALGALLGDLADADALPPVILYCLNAGDFPVLATLSATFAPRVTLGTAWWFNDTERGMREQLRWLMENGLLARSPGMLTDSRSFSSFPRHEYFRRILCDELGTLVEAGRYHSLETAGAMVRDVCYENARRQFGGVKG